MVNSNTWPFQEARKILDRIDHKMPKKGYVLFQTGYGPSGLPHIGTFGEVARTMMVVNAFRVLSDIPAKIFVFSDDMDGLRTVPQNIPNSAILEKNLGKPLSAIPDPYGKYENFADHANSRLKSFLNKFDFEYEFKSATECYKSGMFDKTLKLALINFQNIMDVILPTIGKERQRTYSPFLPICKKTGIVLQVPIVDRDIEAGTITYQKDGEKITTSVMSGNCKMQWKADWALRWKAFDVDYEMHGKDLTPSAKLSAKICKILSGRPPINFIYELFLDEHGGKISKSKGNGLSIEEWLEYSNKESLALFMYKSPQKAKKLYFDVIPKLADEFIKCSKKFDQHNEEKYNNPCWHATYGKVKKEDLYDLDFNLLLNLANVCNPENKNILWKFINKYAPDASPEKNKFLDELVGFIVKYYNDKIKPIKKYRQPSSHEILLLVELKECLANITSDKTSEYIQTQIYNLGMASGYEKLSDYFMVLYETLLGQKQGPRLGSFIALYGIKSSIKIIEDAINRGKNEQK